MLESSLYLGFTSFINFVYENQNPINRSIVKAGYAGLSNFKILNKLFIKQAMGRTNLID